MATPGVLMRILDLVEKNEVATDVSHPALPFSGIEAMYSLDDQENGSSHNTLYFLSDIQAAIDGGEADYLKDMERCTASGSRVSWVIMEFINGRDGFKPDTLAKSQVPAESPVPGSVVVVNGSTPRPDMEQDYHNWYDQEHASKLALVPGWQLARRYKLRKLYGDAETASFYGVNFYSEVNGLGGPEWRAGVTEWTLRIRNQAAKPNVRRVWKLKSAKHM